MFRECTTAEETKKLFKKLAQKLHPDFGGDHHLMVILNNSYEAHLQVIKESEVAWEKYKKEQQEVKEEHRYIKVFEKVLIDSADFNIFHEIFEYAKRHNKFKLDFVESIFAYAEEKGYVTSNQYNAVLKIYYAYNMESEDLNSIKENL